MKKYKSMKYYGQYWKRRLKNYRTYTQVFMPIAWVLNFFRPVRRWYMRFSYKYFGHPSNFHWTYFRFSGSEDSATLPTLATKLRRLEDIPNLKPGERSLIGGCYYDIDTREETA